MAAWGCAIESAGRTHAPRTIKDERIPTATRAKHTNRSAPLVGHLKPLTVASKMYCKLHRPQTLKTNLVGAMPFSATSSGLQSDIL